MKSFNPTNSLFYDKHETTQNFMPQYTYGSMSSPAETETVEDGYGFPATTRNIDDVDARRRRKLVKMVLLTIVCAGTVLWAGGRATASSSLFLARADVAPGTSGSMSGGSFFSWKQYGQGLSSYWSQKGSEWSEMKLDLAAKNATKAEIKEAHDKFWDDSKKAFKYIPDQKGAEESDSEDE
mmetsp:Transcript_18353/g.44318  ORF Transcript_18353/g.44318 Transcript_18353/m.44318 type:complete len:181 (+) Transcript_18353:60-602(+)